MKTTSLIPALLIACLGSANAALILHYDFDTVNGTVVANNVGADGTLTGTTAGAAGYVAGPTGFGTAYDFTNGGDDSNYVQVGISSATLGINNGPYTMAAWVQLDTSATDDIDNMVFGADQAGNGGQLHNGFRDEFPHQGHWGNDQTDQAALLNDSSTWYHMAWTYDGTTQEIYVDGVLVESNMPRGGIAGSGTNLAIGWTGRDTNDAFNGRIDDVRIYNEVLDSAAVNALIPEPASFGLIGLAGLMTLLRRRR